MSGNGLISAKQIRDITGSATTPLVTHTFPAATASRDLANVLTGTVAGTLRSTLHPLAIPLKVGSGLNYNGTDNAYRLDIDGATLTAPGNILTVTSITGLAPDVSQLALAGNSGLSIAGGVLSVGAGTGLTASGNVLNADIATTGAVGVVSVSASGGIAVSGGGALSLNGIGAGTTVSGSIVLSSNTIGVTSGTFVDRATTPSTSPQAIQSYLNINGADVADTTGVAIQIGDGGVTPTTRRRITGVFTTSNPSTAYDSDAASKLYVDTEIAAATAGLNAAIAPANDFIDAATATSGAIINTGRYVALDANISGLGNAIGDILVAVADDTIAGATVLDGGVDFADGSLMNIGDELGNATIDKSGPGLYKYNDSDGSWGFLLPASATNTAEDAALGNIEGTIIPGSGLTMTGSVASVKLSNGGYGGGVANPGLALDTATTVNKGLYVLLNSTPATEGYNTLISTANGIGVRNDGITQAQIADNAVGGDQLNILDTSLLGTTDVKVNIDAVTLDLGGAGGTIQVADGAINFAKLAVDTNEFESAGGSLGLKLNGAYLTSAGGSLSLVASTSGLGPINATHLDLGDGLKAVSTGVDETVTLNVSSSFTFNVGVLTIDAAGVTDGMIDLKGSNSGFAYNSGYGVVVDGSTIVIATNALQVPDDGITLAKIKTDNSSPFASTGAGATQGMTITVDESLEIVSNTLRVSRSTYQKRKSFTGVQITNAAQAPVGNTREYIFDLTDSILSSSESTIVPYRVWINGLELDSAALSDAGVAGTTISFTTNAVDPSGSQVAFALETTDCVLVEYIDVT